MSWADLLERRAAAQADSVAVRLLSDGEEVDQEWTYGDLVARSRRLAGRLRGAGAVGERVLLVYPWGVDYLVALFACFLSGAVAVPLYPPRPRRGWGRLEAVAVDARPALALCDAPTAERAAAELAGGSVLGAVPWLAAAGAELDEGEGWSRRDLGPDSLALLQYTSGSTAAPKGVRIRHGNLLHNLAALESAGATRPLVEGGGWLPFFHDMGLVGLVLFPVHQGRPVNLIPPEAFLYRPLRWLRLISRFRVNYSPAPNFAFDLCLRHAVPEKLEGLDLSCWQVAFNGAERVDAATLRRFAETFAPYGFHPRAFFPCYGLAESTLYTTGTARDGVPVTATFDRAALEEGRVEEVRTGCGAAVELVACGSPTSVQAVEIVDPTTHGVCGAGVVGEIWTAGESVAEGYWGSAELSREAFGARLEGDDRAFLRTGDLGFVHDGELYVAGRIKDLVILAGRNHYPEDIEITAEAAHAGLRPGGAVAFAVGGEGGERLVLAAEVDRRALRAGGGDLEALAAAVREAVAHEHEIAVGDLVLLRPGALPRTTSGKKRRAACRSAYEGGALEPLEKA
ncbi:MAG: fatty acyl-AMP ligase [Planctomycetota bacterium]|nr:fatty acyl-AMP ligase [Planctomycetota bacterium]MDP6988288.1 fatty acyl-AMP ligase [Planctomycetota bacterium]